MLLAILARTGFRATYAIAARIDFSLNSAWHLNLPSQNRPDIVSSSFARRAIGSDNDFISLRGNEVELSHSRAESLNSVAFCAQTLGVVETHPNKVTGSGLASRDFARPQAHMHHNMEMVTHDGPGVNAAGENSAKLQNTRFNPGFSVLEAFAEVLIEAAQPRPAHAAVHAMKRADLVWVDELAAGLGHKRSLGLRTLRANQIRRNLYSDLSESDCFRKRKIKHVKDYRRPESSDKA